MNIINGSGYMSDAPQYDRKEYYEPLNSVEYVYKIGTIQSVKNYSDIVYDKLETDRVNEMRRLREIQNIFVEIQKNAQITHKKVTNELLTKAKCIETNVKPVKKETSCAMS